MSRRSGKAASRRARQQRRSRRPASPAPEAARPAAPTLGVPLAAGQATRAPSAAPAPVSARPLATSAYAAGTSRLGEAARAEYHYVARDLRNTAILVLVMAALLGVAVAVVNVAGIGPS